MNLFQSKRLNLSPHLSIGIAISLLCLWLALRDVPFRQLGQILAGGHYLWLILAIAFQLLAIVARAQRWVVLLGKQARLSDSFWAQSVGYLFTNVLPFRMGEPARVLVMSDRSQLPLAQVAASAIVERLLDVATMILALVLVLPLMQVPVLVIRAGTVFGAIILVLVATLFLMVRFRELVERLLQSICRWYKFLPAVAIVARQRELIDGLTPLTSGSSAIRSIAWSIATWALSMGTNWAVIRSFKSDAAPVEAVFMIVALSLAIAVPTSPGFIGVFQLVGQQALVLPFGGKYDLTTALAIALTAHLTYYLLTTTLGVVGLLRLGESFGHLGQLVRRQASPKAVSSNVII